MIQLQEGCDHRTRVELRCFGSKRCCGSPVPHLWHSAASCRLFKMSSVAAKKSNWDNIYTGEAVPAPPPAHGYPMATSRERQALTGAWPEALDTPGCRGALPFLIVFHSLLRMLNVYKRSKVNGWKSQSIKSIKYKDTTQELPEPTITGCWKDIWRKFHFVLSCCCTFSQAPAFGHCRRQSARLDGLSAIYL